MQTYIISNGHQMKIGKSMNALVRCKQLQTSSAARLKLLTVIDGDIEDTLHIKFAESRVLGEWFDPSAALTLFLSTCEPYKEENIRMRPSGKKHGWHVVTEATKAKWQAHWERKRRLKLEEKKESQ